MSSVVREAVCSQEDAARHHCQGLTCRRARSPLVRRRTTIVLTLSLGLVPLVGCGSGHKTATSTTRQASPRNDGAPPSTRRAATPVVATPGIITTVAGS